MKQKSPIPLEVIRHGRMTCAIILRKTFKATGLQFLTPGNYSQQLAWMSHPRGKKIAAHIHRRVPRAISQTQEVLYLTRGSLRVDFYTNAGKYLGSRILQKGDLIMLVSAGHGFEVLKDLEMIEVKQGPYLGEKDKIRFRGAGPTRPRLGRIS